jgi:hypothetical protein
MESVRNTVNSLTSDFSSSNEIETTDSDFLNSNGFIAKIVFLILVIVIFIVLFYLIVMLMSYFTSPSENPIIINGQINGDETQVIGQNPALNESKLVQRSNNETSGIEFTWTLWLYINPSNINDVNKYYPVFIKGDSSKDGNATYNSLNHGPGLYLYKEGETYNMQVLMDTIDSPAIENPSNIINIPNAISNQYFHLAIRCKGKYIDIYVNGTIVSRTELQNVPKQNYYDITLFPDSNLSGCKLSNLRYFNRGLSVVEINSMYRNGPNTKALSTNSLSTISSVSTLWFNSFIR